MNNNTCIKKFGHKRCIICKKCIECKCKCFDTEFFAPVPKGDKRDKKYKGDNGNK